MTTLVTTLHDPEGALWPLAAPHVAGWLHRFDQLLLFTSPAGGGETAQRMAEAGARVVWDEAPQGIEQMGRVRLRALEAARPATWYMLVDFDRLIHWERHFPGELRTVERGLTEHDFLVLGRTPRAFATHPTVQRDTEQAANGAFAAASGRAWDVTGGARGLSARARALLGTHARCATLGVDAEWPLLCLRHGLHVGYREVEGLEWETADRYPDEIARLGRERWLREQINTPQAWATRLRIAWQIAAAAAALHVPDRPATAHGAALEG